MTGRAVRLAAALGIAATIPCAALAIGMAQETAGAGAAPQRGAARQRPPVSEEVLKITLPRPAEADLANGAHLMVLEDHRVPSVSFQILMMGAGGYYDPADLPGLAETTASLMREGTTTRTSQQIAEQLETMAATLTVSATEGSQIASVSGTCLTDQLDEVLALAADVLLRPSFPQEEIERYKTRARASLAQQRTDPDFLAEERFSKAIYGTHPAASMGTTVESLERIARDSLVTFHRASYVPDHAIIGVSGDITLAEARKKLEAALEPWKKSSKPRPSVTDPPEAPPAKVYLTDRLGSVQTTLLVGQQAINRTSPDYDIVSVMNRILGGSSSARLFRVLREQKGYTYGAYSSVSALRYRGDWRAQTDVRTEVTEPALRDLLAEIARMRDEPVPATEFANVQRAMVAAFALSLESPGAILQSHITRWLYGFPADYWDRYSERIMAVTPAQVQAAARKYLTPARLQIVAVGDRTKIAQGLAQFGPLESFDADGQPLASGAVAPAGR